MSTYVKLGDRSIVTSVIGGIMGNKNARQAMKVTWDKAMSSHPRLEAWDSGADLAAGIAPTDEILAGTASTGNKSWLAGAETTSVAPGANWYASADERTGGTSPAKLIGSGAYLLLKGATVGVVSRLFNLCLKVPSDAGQVGVTQHTPVIALRYYYTGSVPAITWQYNASTIANPKWTTFNGGSAGFTLHFTGPDTTTTTLDPFTKPNALTEVNEYWAQTA